MMRPPRLLAVIPARLGSRRVPRKNIRDLLGRPAISYTIAAAVDSDLFDRVVVSTDAEEIATVARSYGAEVPFLRRAALADDHTHVSAVTADALGRIDPDGRVTAVAQLLPNCPLRTADDVRSSYAQFAESRALSQLSVTRFGWQNPWWASRLAPDSTLEPLFPEAMTRRSQELAELYCPTGAVWWAGADVLRREGTFHVAGRTGWVMPWHRAVDIDTEDDWLMAEQLLQLSQMHGAADVR